MLLWLLRGAYLLLLLGIAVYTANVFLADDGEHAKLNAIFVPIVTVVVGAFVMFTDIREKQKQITTISAIYFGLLLGLLLGWLFSMALVPLLDSTFDKPQITILGRVQLTLVCWYVTISTLLQTKDE
ncbi:MAG TPA: PIN/TRAM domain-containing protein, partial [Urbifossiella sp.]